MAKNYKELTRAKEKPECFTNLIKNNPINNQFWRFWFFIRLCKNLQKTWMINQKTFKILQNFKNFSTGVSLIKNYLSRRECENKNSLFSEVMLACWNTFLTVRWSSASESYHHGGTVLLYSVTAIWRSSLLSIHCRCHLFELWHYFPHCKESWVEVWIFENHFPSFLPPFKNLLSVCTTLIPLCILILSFYLYTRNSVHFKEFCQPPLSVNVFQILPLSAHIVTLPPSRSQGNIPPLSPVSNYDIWHICHLRC